MGQAAKYWAFVGLWGESQNFPLISFEVFPSFHEWPNEGISPKNYFKKSTINCSRMDAVGHSLAPFSGLDIGVRASYSREGEILRQFSSNKVESTDSSRPLEQLLANLNVVRNEVNACLGECIAAHHKSQGTCHPSISNSSPADCIQ